MAKPALRLSENAPGPFYVDSTCIDCGTCRWVAPETFAAAASGGASIVRRQPADDAERLRATMALVACPTASIGTADARDARRAARAFPDPVEEGGDVAYVGFASPDSFGAASWRIGRPEGNVLVDSPRAAGTLLDALDGLGGVATLFLTHRDDVADHARLRERFGCERVMHRRDRTLGTRGVERWIDGDDPVALGDGLLAIPVPGHTPGSAALLWRDRFLFSGDHLWGAEDGGGLEASREVCWFDWDAQIRSTERLLEHDFEWVLPGHGFPWRAESPAAMRREVEQLVRRMKRER